MQKVLLEALNWESANLEMKQLLIFPHQKCYGTGDLWKKEDSWTGSMSSLRAWTNIATGFLEEPSRVDASSLSLFRRPSNNALSNRLDFQSTLKWSGTWKEPIMVIYILPQIILLFL